MALQSKFGQLFLALQAKVLADIPDSPATPGIRLVDMDFRQIDQPGTRPPIASGGNLYVDFANTIYEQRQLKTQMAQMDILLRLAFDPYSSSASIAPQAVREKALAFFEIEHKLYVCLQDWTADGLLTVPMKRISAVTEERPDQLRVRDIVFKATCGDYSAAIL